MKRMFALLLTLSLLLSGCAGALEEQKQYTATFLTVFDTVTTIVGRDASEAAFTEKAQAIHDELIVYHQLFDIYNVYEGLNNLKTVNDHPGEAVTVDQAIIDLLLDCKRYYELTGGRVNAAMGSVLYLWHEAREDGLNDIENAYLPDSEALAEAAKHTSWDNIVIDDEHNTVTITDPMLRLDVGAIAKGWSVQRVADNAPEGLLISVGGNVCATGAKDAAGTPWVVGVQNPDGGESYLHTLYLTRGSMVTSGDYQRLSGGRAALPSYHRPRNPVSGQAVAGGDGGLPRLRPCRCPVHGAVPAPNGRGAKASGRVRKHRHVGRCRRQIVLFHRL